MTDQRCETCRFWKSPVDSFVTANVGVCLLARAGRDDFDENGWYAARNSDVCLLDYPVCDLITGPNFGCVKWQEKREDEQAT